MAFDVREYAKKRAEDKATGNSTSNGSFNVQDYVKRKNLPKVGEYLNSSINNWLKKNELFVKSYNSRYSGDNEAYRADASDWLSTVTTRKGELESEANEIRKWLDSYKDYLDKDYYKSVTQALDVSVEGYEKMLTASSKDYEFWSQFDSEDTYNAWLKQYKDDEAYKGWLQNVDLNKAAQGWEQYLVDDEKDRETYISGEEGEKWYETLGRWLGSGGVTDTSLPMGTTTQAIHGLRDDQNGYQSYRRPKDDWTAEQRNKFGELYLVSPESAFMFAEETNERNNKAKEEAALKAIMESATSSVGAGIAHTAGAMATSVFGMADFISELTYANAGMETPEYDGVVSPFEYSQAVTGGISNHLNTVYGTLNESIPVIGGKGWGDVYGLGVSTAQSMASAYTLGGAGSLISYFGQGAAAGMKDAKDRGATDAQAVLYGTALGVFEGVAEMIGIDNLFKLGSASTIKGLIMNILKQAGAEGAEEGLTSFLGIIADAFVMQDKSNIYQAFQNYRDSGMSEFDAGMKVFWDSVEDVAFDAAGGFVSGGVSGGIHTTAQTISANTNAKKLYGNGADLVTEASEIGGDAGTLAEKYQAKLDKGKSLSGGQINQLIEVNEQALKAQDIAKIRSSAEARLTQLGEKGNVSAIAEVLAKQASGEKLSRSEITILKNSKYGQRVANEMSPENIKSGEYTSAWAENLGTQRVNVEAYNKELYDTSEASAQQVENTTEAENASTKENATEGKFEASVEGKTIVKESGKAVSIEEIVSNEGGSLMVKLDSGETVNAKDLVYSTAEEGLLYEMVANMGVNPKTAMALIKAYNPSSGVKAQTYAIDVPLAYQYGKIGNKKGLEKLNLSPEQSATAYVLGKDDAKIETDSASGALRESLKQADEKADASATRSKKEQVRKGKVRFEYGAKARGKEQRHIVALAKVLSSAMGIDFYFYDSTIEGTPEEKSNGYFNPKDNSIHLDLQNSMTDAKTIAYSMSHELVHFIKKWSPAKFKVFADFLMEQYGEHGVDTDAMLQNMMNKLGTTDVNEAFEEMVCEACERMLLDSNATVKLAQLRAKDAGLFEKIKAHILDILNKIRTEYKKYSPSSDEAQALDKMGDVMEKFYALFEDMAVDATQTYQEAVSLNAESVVMTEDGTIKMQMKQYEQTGRTTLYNYLKEQYGVNDANSLISTIDNIYNVLKEVKQNEALSVFSNWQDTDIELDEDGHPIFTTSINNGDYELNQDFSRVCKKRRQLDFVLNMLAEDTDFEASNLTKQDFVKINKAIKAHGFEIACALCFVDSKRFRQAEWADSFANTWNDILNSIVADNGKLTPFNFATKNPNIADEGIEIDTSKAVTYRKWSDGKEDVKNRRTYESFEQILAKDADGKWLEGNTNVRTIATLLRDHPELRHTFRGADIIASQGFDTIQRLAPGIRNILDGWGGSSVPKPSSNDASYDSSILNSKGYNKETAYAMGGVRMNSFSDFMAHMFFDYCQAFADLSAKELPSQAYTKELTYVRFFGRSGQKINMSGIAAIRDNALPTVASKSVSKAEAEANEKIEKMVAGLDITRLLEHLNKDIYQLTEADVEQFLDMCDYVWADESINMKHATLLQTGILYDKLTESKIEECYELLKVGEIEQALKVAGEENVDAEYAKHCGTIVVGVSDAHIRKLLRDPNIRMVIPYHKSGLNPTIARELQIAVYNDYTPVQNTGVVRKGAKSRSNLTSEEIKKAYGLKDFAFYDWFGKTIDGKVYDGKATADKYLEWCEKGYYDESVGDYVYYTTKQKGYILASELHKKLTVEPKFKAFIGEENYYKLLEDFDCYNTITGEHSAQGAVDFLRNGLPSDYKTVLMDALNAEQKVHDDFRDHLDNKGLKEEIMEIAKPKTAPKTIEGVKRQLKSVKPIEPSSDKWQRTHTTEEVKAQFPNLWDVSADESEVRNPTQISGTVKSYRKIYDFLKRAGFNGTILDASSGLGYGTRAGIDEYGFNVEDIEPYPDKSYTPKYTDYSALDKKYDVIISNAVLNVLPQDQRDALVVKMGELLNEGGRLFVNVRGDDVKNASSKEAINEDLMEYYISKSGSYQKGFTKSELVAYLEDALGDGYTVMPTSFFGKTSAVVTKSGTSFSQEFIDQTLDSFGITKPKDFIHVQRQVLDTLIDEGFFTDVEKRSRTDINEESGMVIETNKSGIDETFDMENYRSLGIQKKIAKLATIRMIPEAIQKGKLDADNINNQYGYSTNKRFAYITHEVEIDGKKITLRLDIKKSPQKNKFWVHHVELIENVSDSPASTENGTEAGQTITDNGDIITQDVPKVKRQLKSSSNSTRTLLANALETTAQNDIEKTKLEQYKSKIDLIESEYEKLTELRAKIKELSFAKGARDTKAIKALQFEANQTANRINVYDRQLLTLESTTALKNVLNREKELARRKEAQKGKEALAKYREKAAQTQRALMEKNTESRKKAIEGRDKTAMRHKIRNIVEDLNNLLLNPTKDKHIPIGLQKPVASALAVINMDTVGADERIAKYNELIAKSNNPDEIARLTKSRDNIEFQGENLKDKLVTLQNAYAALLKSDDPLVRNSHNEAIENLIENTVQKVGDTSIRNMSLEQLEAVYDMFKAVKATVRNANKMFKEGKQETITDNSELVKREVRSAGGHRDRVLKATKFLKKFGWNMLKPIYAMKLIGSDTFTGLYENVRKGEDTWAVDVNEAKDFFKETAKKYEYNVWDFKKQYKFADSAGHSFSLTLEQIMSLYAYSKRTQADKHLELGGFIFDDSIEVTKKNKLGIPMKYEVNDANPYRLKKEDLAKIIDLLESQMPNVKGFVDEMQAYLSNVMGAKGNEVSLAMYDIKLYKEQNYFPLKSARYFREFDPEKNGTPKIKNSGFSKNTVPQAGNPIILSNFMDVWANHVNDMSMYHAFVLPLEDFMRVYNYSSTMGGYDSVQQYIKNAYGSQANSYIETLMNDLNGGARTDPATDLIGKGMSLFKKAAVFASASVVIQQPSAIARTLAYIDPKYFVDKPNATKHSETWAEVKKYAPVAIIKEMGYFDTNMGRSTVDWIKEEKTLRDKIDDIASKAPALADELAWCAIWKAVKREVADTTNLKVGSEEFLKTAGKKFTEVVTKTQVYDSVLSRSSLMRSKDTGAKMVTAFMAEPTTSLNMVVDALIEGKRGNKKFAGKVIGAVSASIILNSILVSFVTAARDDDEDETYFEKYLESLTTEIIDGFNPLTYIPLIKDIWSIAQGYDVERSDMSIWSDLWQSVENLFSNNKSGFEKVEGVVGSIASIFGLPLKNLMRDARALYNLAETMLRGTPTTWAGIGDAVGGAVKDSIPLYSRIEKFVGADDSKSDKLYDAIISGDQKHIDRVKAQYKDEKAIESAIRQGLRENDSRIHEAAQARYKGDIEEYKRIAKDIISEGNFSQDTVVAAINAEINAIEKGEAPKEDTTDNVEKATSIYKASDINSAFENGDTEMALEVIDDLVKTKVENYLAEARKEAEESGKTFNERKAQKEAESKAKSSIRASMTSYWKPLYKEAYKSGNTAEKERIERILKASGLYGNASEVIKTCREWRTERD